MSVLVSFLTGALFAVGLALSGMTQPQNIIHFLDVTGDWDPRLAFVMAGGVLVFALLHRVVLRRGAPLLGGAFALPTRRDLEPRLVIGSALFGIGWGIGGFCPGPAITAVATLGQAPLVFVTAMAAGMMLHDLVFVRLSMPAGRATPQPF